MCGRRGARQVPRDTAEQQRVGDPVDRRVEEGAALARGVLGLGERAVEQVGQRGEDHQQQADAQVFGPDRDRGTDADEQPEDGQVVRREAGLAQEVADRLDRPVDRCPELAVEHRMRRYPSPTVNT